MDSTHFLVNVVIHGSKTSRTSLLHFLKVHSDCRQHRLVAISMDKARIFYSRYQSFINIVLHTEKQTAR